MTALTIKSAEGTQNNSMTKWIGWIATGVQINVQYWHTKPRERFSYATLSREDQCLHEALEVEAHVRRGRAGTHAVFQLRTLLVGLCKRFKEMLSKRWSVHYMRMHKVIVYVKWGSQIGLQKLGCPIGRYTTYAKLRLHVPKQSLRRATHMRKSSNSTPPFSFV